MGNLYFLLAATVTVLALVLIRAVRSVRSLHRRSTAELDQLKSLLASRHLIFSHLVDSLPSTFDRRFGRRKLGESLERAEGTLKSIDPVTPRASDIRTFAHCEQDFLELLDGLMICLEADDSVCSNPSVAACLQGLEEVTKRIEDGISTYNAAAITYTSYLESLPFSLFTRFYASSEFSLFDLNPDSSDTSIKSVHS